MTIVRRTKDVIAFVSLTIMINNIYKVWRRLGTKGTIRWLIRLVLGWIIKNAKNTAVKPLVEKKIESALASLSGSIPKASPIHLLPSKGLSSEEIINSLQKLSDMGHREKVSGAIYHGGKELQDICSDAFSIFQESNPLHPDVFPGVRQMESDIIRMVLGLFNAPENACGCISSGGTESILLACLSYRERCRAELEIEDPEMILCETAHAAFDKACHYFGIKAIQIASDQDGLLDPKIIEKLINKRTILIVASCPSFPHGTIDPISEIAKIALKNNIGLHVDCCLGSFLLPFMEKLGYELPLFDFRVQGVTSISCDTHKYGFAPKGTSVLMYREKKQREYQYYVNTEWTGGVYACPTLAGSRSGGLIAGCWAAMMFLGEQGYMECTKKIIESARFILEE